MNQKISPIIQANELLELYRTREVVIVDAGNRVNYNEKHLDKAIFIDLGFQLADIKDDFKNGGRHPLPSIEKFAETLTKLGINNRTHVIIYDDRNGSNAAARFWWMLKSVGHQKVQVLNGGIQQAEKIGFLTNSKPGILKIVDEYKTTEWQLGMIEIDEVEKVCQSGNHLVVDVREEGRYKGEFEPIDLIAGHVPGAINVPFSTNLQNDGKFLPPNELKKKYQEIFGEIKSENIVFHCGSGVTACHSLLAIDYAGLDIPKLYVGSWSEWSRNNLRTVTGSI